MLWAKILSVALTLQLFLYALRCLLGTKRENAARVTGTDAAGSERPWHLRAAAGGPAVSVRPANQSGARLFGSPGKGPVFGPVRFGRAPDNDVVLEDPTVSAHHARFYLRGGFLWVEDLHSTNGTLVNGARIWQVLRLREGDRVDIGTNTFEVTR